MKIPQKYSNTRLREIVGDFVHSERDRAILIRKYCDKRTVGQLAEEFQVSDTTVKNIIYKHSFMIFDMIEKEQLKDG